MERKIGMWNKVEINGKLWIRCGYCG